MWSDISLCPKTLYIEPGPLSENGYCESFNGKLRCECLNGEILCSLKEARTVIKHWKVKYNTVRPHFNDVASTINRRHAACKAKSSFSLSRCDSHGAPATKTGRPLPRADRIGSRFKDSLNWMQERSDRQRRSSRCSWTTRSPRIPEISLVGRRGTHTRRYTVSRADAECQARLS